MDIRRLNAEFALEIVSLFSRVYGQTYANPLFYDSSRLTDALATGALKSVGALTASGDLAAHMAMVRSPGASSAELGNTVVDPAFRGEGLAWQVGAELTAWCRELGHPGYLHYPTCDHAIMQKQSVKRGIETGLMLGYIPAETDGRVSDRSDFKRQAATIVYEPLARGEPAAGFLPGRYRELIMSLQEQTRLEREWEECTGSEGERSSFTWQIFERRGLARLEVSSVGVDLKSYAYPDLPCLQVDFLMSDPALETGIEYALSQGFVFCGWLPGFRENDVIRLQRVDLTVTDLDPDVVNPGAKNLLELIRETSV